MRLTQPDLFRTKVYPHLAAVSLNRNDDDVRLVEVRNMRGLGDLHQFYFQIINMFICWNCEQGVCSELQYVDNLDPQLREIIKKQLRMNDEFSRNTKRAKDSPYTTVVHRDLWVNNVMILRGKSLR